ncbi:hypothetical protein ACGFSB_25040 [Streptomyces sp. NPDC048441]|uniref:hypothetical protein n=1 Tax=Streptomyces sp. NPDC048441 TaxID=3365552 RepID=UPI00372085DB
MAHVPSDIPSSSSPPPPCPVPHFAPVRVRGGQRRLRRLLRHRRRAMAAGLAVTAAALVAAGPRDAERARPPEHPAAAAAPSPERREQDRREQEPRAAALVTAPVRIADAETVRLLHRGDRVDVVAADGSASRVVAAGARVAEVPEPQGGAAESAAESGALVVLSVPRATAARLAGAGARARLAVTLC